MSANEFIRSSESTYLAESIREEQRLEQGVQIASCALVAKTDHASLFLGVVAKNKLSADWSNM